MTETTSKTSDAVVPKASDAVPWEESRHGDNFHIRYRNLSAGSGSQPYKIGVSIEELMPGKQNNPAHYHLRDEEHVLILAGELTVRIGKAFHRMVAGDHVRFPAGNPEEHCLFNHTDTVCRYIIIGDNHPEDVVIYPDSNKVMVEALGQRFARTHVEYWVGEGGLTGKGE